MNRQVSPAPELKTKILQAVESGKKKRGIRPAAVLAAALACLLVFTVPVCVLAAENPGFNSMLYEVSPGLAQFFKPVDLSCEDNGIRLEVESAAVEGDTCQVYLTLQDLTGDRIDETVDLNDSAGIRQARDCITNCRLVEYEEETKTARFLLTSTAMDGGSIAGDKITFSISNFLSHITEYKDVEIPVDWENLPQESPSRDAVYTGGGGAAGETLSEIRKAGLVRVLKPMEPAAWPVEGIELTGIGFINGQLHVQTAVKNVFENDNHGYFWLEDRMGNRTECLYNAYFRFDEDDSALSRQDAVFDSSREALRGSTLHGTFWVSGSDVPGSGMKRKKQASCGKTFPQLACSEFVISQKVGASSRCSIAAVSERRMVPWGARVVAVRPFSIFSATHQDMASFA